MCLILFAYRWHPHYPLVLAANRDEFYDRPTAPLAFWPENLALLAGRDLAAGGTWLGVNRQGRLAAITNYRDPANFRPQAPSRGPLVSDFLQSQEPAQTYLQRLQLQADDYNGFNLLLGDDEGLHYYSNQGGEPRVLSPGLYGLSNHLLNTPWPKVERGKRDLAAALSRTAELVPETLWPVLGDRTPAPDEALPATGVSLEWERALSPLFIATPGYGTRSSTLLWIDPQHQVTVQEKSWPQGDLRTFQLQWPPAATGSAAC
jgi:uncharacterized protein with NRDE domain